MRQRTNIPKRLQHGMVVHVVYLGRLHATVSAPLAARRGLGHLGLLVVVSNGAVLVGDTRTRLAADVLFPAGGAVSHLHVPSVPNHDHHIAEIGACAVLFVPFGVWCVSRPLSPVSMVRDAEGAGLCSVLYGTHLVVCTIVRIDALCGVPERGLVPCAAVSPAGSFPVGGKAGGGLPGVAARFGEDVNAKGAHPPGGRTPW